MSERIPRAQMIMDMAFIVAARSTCSRLHVGAIIHRDFRPISTGYNGVAAGLTHCVHTPADQRCERAVHAEANAITFAARHGVATDGAALAVTHQPCIDCAKLIINAGIRAVLYAHPYRDPSGLLLLKDANVGVVTLPKIRRA